MAIKKNQKGQAAITDALYFLTIVSSLCIFLFVFATSYGLTVAQSIKDRYLEEYESSALKTILYSSTPRNADASGTSEMDFLLAAVKEDYADDKDLNETKMVLLNNIKQALSSKSDSFDYIFYIYSTDDPTKPFPYFLFYKSEWPEEETTGYRRVKIDCAANPDKCGHSFWFCKPQKLSQIDTLLLGVGGTPPTKNRIKLVKLEPKTTSEGTRFDAKAFTAEAFLKIWPSTLIDDAAFAQLNCCKAGTDNCPAPDTP
jgi:hypothetical protein